MTERVALVKSAGRADAFAQAVRALGLVPVLVSPYRVELVPGADEELARAFGAERSWLAVTSPHAVTEFLAACSEEFDRIVAVGHGTAAALQAAGVRVDLVGDGGASALGQAMVRAGLAADDTVVHLCGEDARPELRTIVTAMGARYLPVVAYRMLPDEIGERSAAGAFAAVVVGSPNLARRAADLFPARPPAVAIGRTTAAALRDLGWTPAAVAAEPTPADVVAALSDALGRARP